MLAAGAEAPRSWVKAIADDLQFFRLFVPCDFLKYLILLSEPRSVQACGVAATPSTFQDLLSPAEALVAADAPHPCACPFCARLLREPDAEARHGTNDFWLRTGK